MNYARLLWTGLFFRLRELTAPLLAQPDGVEVGRVSSREPTLEDAYVALVEAA